MLKRQKSGSVVCPSCGRLVGVNDASCFHCGRPFPGMWGFAKWFQTLSHPAGFIQLMIGGCVILYLASLAFDPKGISSGGLMSLLGPSRESLFVLGSSGAVPVFQFGRWWTVLSAGWLHGGLLHIGFNLYWLYQLGPQVAELYGVGRMVIIYTTASVVGFALSSSSFLFPGILHWIMGGGAGFTVGASAAIFGLLGALVYFSRRGGSSHIGRQAWSFAIFLFAFGLFMRGVDNWAHLGGFLGGYLASRLLDPLRPERVDHLVGAVVCLVLTAVSIGASIWTGWPFLAR
jgi:rhomboid protease GluP